ncbi:MAG TPA: condensation domain-containing protein, partial [Bacteroidales bacterium]|nr:condensation domain-containing protein [Bacteroidales bacterium]
MPRTENGKVDRRLLPLPGMVSQSEFREPKPGAESQVCGIVANLLSLDRVSPSDNFFDLGGNSLTIARFLIRVKQLTGKELSVSSVFEAPVLADIAAELETCSAAVEKKGIVYSFCPRDRVYYPMTPVEKDLFLLQKLDPTGKQHYIVLQLSILSNKEEHFIRDVLNEIFKRHEAFRSAFVIVDDTPVQELLKEPKSSVLFKDIADLNPLEQKKTIQALLNRLGNISFDLATGYTFEMVLLRLSNERFLLLMSLNHLIFDGWSMGVFMNEFRRIYREKLSLTGQVVFKDGYQMVDVGFSLSQIPLDYYNDSLKFWSDYLGKGVMVLPYREGADRKAAGRKGKRLWWRFDKQTSWGLQQLARREKTTLFSLFLAGYSLMLKHYSNDHDIVIGTPIAGRDDDALTQVIGYLTNMVPVRLVIGEDQNFQNYLLKVTQNVVAALSHGDIAFGKLLKHLDVVTRPGLSPLFQVIMVMQNWPEQNISLDEPILKQKEVGNNTVRADLTFNVELVDDEIECWLEYDTELFEDSMAGRMQ